MQVVEFVESLFVDMFNKLHEKCKEDFQAIQNQHPYEKLKVNFFLTNDSLTFPLRRHHISFIFLCFFDPVYCNFEYLHVFVSW